MRDQSGRQIQNPRPRRAAHPFERGGDGEINFRRVHVKGQKPRRLGDIHPDQAAHPTAMRHHLGQVDAVRGCGRHPCQQRQADIRRPIVQKILILDMSRPLTQRHGFQRKATAFGQALQQKVVRGEAIRPHQHLAPLEMPGRQRGQKRVKGLRDAFKGRGRPFRRVDNRPPTVNKRLPFAQSVSPLPIIRRAP